MRVRFRAPATTFATAVFLAACVDGGQASLSPDGGLTTDGAHQSLSVPDDATADTLAIGASVKLELSTGSVALRGDNGSEIRMPAGVNGHGKTTWATSDDAIVSVNKSGVAKAVGAGVAFVVGASASQTDTTWFVVLGETTSPPPDTTTPTPIPPPTETAPPPAPAPAPTPAPTVGKADPALVVALMGTVPPVATAEAMGPAFAKYEGDFRTWYESHWATDGAAWDKANYYDRAMISYVWWARTGDQKYLDRGNALALDYRKNYLEANNYGASAYWAMLDGLALHYLLTGDEASRTAVGRVADVLAVPYYVGNLGDPTAEMDNRTQARVLMAFVLARHIQAPSRTGQDWTVRARDALTKILASQAADGAYRFTWKPTSTTSGTSQCGYNKPFMVGVLNDALIRYYVLFEQDARILPAVKKAVDYMWANNWYVNEQAFTYLEGPCGTATNPTEWGGPGPSPDLNNLIVNGFGWVYKMTGDASYKTRGDAVFASGVNAAWLAGSKQFNEEYHSSYRYLGMR